MFASPRASSLLAFGLSLSFTFTTASAVGLDTQSHLAVPGDFNGDGRMDALLQPLTIADQSAIVLQDGTGNLTVLAQGWDPGYLGLDWSTGASTLTTADLNGDGQDDVIVQPRKLGGTAAVLITDPTVQFLQISQLLPQGYLGLDWSSASHVIVAGDFDGDRHKDLLMLAAKRAGTSALVHADADGHLVAVMQPFADGFLGRHWDMADENVYVGDFNGDGRADLLVQSRLALRGESAYALLLADPDGRFSHIAETWNLKDLGADWNPATHKILIEDANHDGIMDIVVQSTVGGTNYVFTGNAQGLFTQPAAHWTDNKSASDVLNTSTNKTGGNGISVSIGPTANSISAPTNPEQDPVIQRPGGSTGQAQGSGQIMTVNAAGVLQGSGGVSGGTATYSIPIAVPPGIAGMQPSLSLSYSSRGGNGEAGMGWSLSAGSQIHRCPATMVMDGYSAGVTYTSMDRLCLDGQHLIAIPGSAPYGTNGAEYRTELSSFVKIVESGSIATGTSSFTVKEKNGHILYYGYGSNAGSSQNTVFQAYNTVTSAYLTTPLAWGLGMEADTYNNSAIYSYTNYGLGEYLLTSIKYTGNGQQTAGTREVDFSYQTRGDASNQYLAGGLTRQTQLLSTITTKVNGAVVETYNTEYNSSNATSRTLLAGVQECGGSGSTQSCLPETTFTWQNPTTQFHAPTQIDLDFDPNQGTPDAINTNAAGDFDGDGRKDVVLLAAPLKSTVYLLNADGSVRNGEGIDISNLFGTGTVPWDESADINNDGATDLLGAGIDTDGTPTFTYSTYKNGAFQTPKSLHVPSSITVQGQPYPTFVAVTDVDGDGRADIVVIVADPGIPGNHMLAVYLNQTTPCSPRGSCTNTASFSATPTKLISLPDYTDPTGQVHIINAKPAGDMDGNGLPDFQISYSGGSGPLGDGWVFTQENSNGTLVPQSSVTSSTAAGVAALAQTSSTSPRMMDINGDGLPDIIYDCSLSNHDWCYQLNVGGSFAHYVDTGIYDGETGAIVTADIDNDGRQEMLAPGTMLADYCVFEGNYRSPDGTTGPDWTCADQTDSDYWVPQLSAARDHSIYEYASYKFIAQADPNTEDGSGYRFVPYRTDLHIVGQNGFAQAMDLQGDGLTGLVSPFTTGGSRDVKFIKKIQNLFFGLGISSNSAGSATSVNAAPDLMLSATDGFGHMDQWNYYPLSSPKSYGSGANLVPLYYSPAANGGYAGDDYFYFASSMYVVGDYSVSNGAGGMNTHDFHYAQAIYNSQGRGFQGFRTVVDDDMVSGARTVQIYHQRFPLSGLLQESWTTSQTAAFDLTNPVADPGAVDHVTSTAACFVGPNSRPFASGTFMVDPVTDPVTCTQTFDSSVYWGYTQASAEHKQDLNGARIADTTANQSYDKFGNETAAHTGVTDDNTAYTSDVASTFDTSDGADWWVDKLQTKIVTNHAVYLSQPDPGSVARETDYSYDTVNNGRGLLTVDAKADNDPAHEVITRYTYSRGNVTSVTVSGGSGVTAVAARTTSTAYAGADPGYFPTSVTDVLGHTTNIVPDPRFGTPTTVTDPDTVVATNTYDVFGRKTSVQVGNLPVQTTSYITSQSSDGMCNGTTALSQYYVLVSQAGYPNHYNCYDMLNRVIRTVGESFASESDLVYTGTDYDARGRVTRFTEPHFSSAAVVWNYNAYYADILGRLQTRTDAKGVVTTYTYGGPVTDIVTTTPASTGTAEIYLNPGYSRHDQEIKNSLGKLLTVTNGIGTTDSVGNSIQAATYYNYDSDGNPIVITAVDGSQILAQYNILGQKLQVQDPDQGTTSYTYDVLGELKTQTDAKGQTLTMTYDNGGRMTGKTSSVSGEPAVTWAYDSCTNGIGKLCSVTKGDGTNYSENYGYDTLGRVKQDEEVIDNTPYDTATSYDADGRVDTVTYPASIANATPVANAGTTQYVAPGATVTLNGSATDSDGPQLPAYQWSQTAGPAVTLSSGTVASPTFTAGAVGTSYIFQLTADDGLSAGTASVTVNVPALPAAPTGLTDTGDTNHDGTYTVSWNTVSVPGTSIVYHLEEAGGTSSGPTQSYTQIYSGSATSAALSHPGNSYYYYWYRVRAETKLGSTSIGYGSYSATDSIHEVVAPGEPSSISPANGSSSTGSYTISWSAYTGSLPAADVYYELYESTASNFAGQYEVYSGTSRSYSTHQTQLLDFYYEVRACNANNGLGACSPYRAKAHIIVTGTGGQQQAPVKGGTQAPAPTTSTGPTGAVLPGMQSIPDLSPSTPIQELAITTVTAPTLHPATSQRTRRAAQVRPRFALPVYQAWADAHLATASGTTPVVSLKVQYQYTANGYLWKLVDAINPNRVFWRVNEFAGGSGNTDSAGNFYEHGMDARGNVTDSFTGSGAINTHFGYGPNTGYLASIVSSGAGSQNLSYTWFAIGNLQKRNALVDTNNLSETFDYDVHNRLLDSTVTNGNGAQLPVTYSYYNNGNLRCKSDVVGHACDGNSSDYSYGQGGAFPHAVSAVTNAGSYGYDANGNMNSRNGTTVIWNSDNLPTNLSQDVNDNSAFSYAPDKHRYKQVAMNAGAQETTLYAGGLEIFTSGGTTHYKHTLMAYGRPVYLDDFSNSGTSAVETKSALLTDHLGSVDTVVDLTASTSQLQSFNTFGRHRDPNTWVTQAANTATITKRGYTDHEHLDQLGLVHMNGRVYDPMVGRFLSVDPMFQAPTNSQSVNPYSYVMNNPLSLVDPSGYDSCGSQVSSADGTGTTTVSCNATASSDGSNLKAGQSATATVHVEQSTLGSHITNSVTITATVTAGNNPTGGGDNNSGGGPGGNQSVGYTGGSTQGNGAPTKQQGAQSGSSDNQSGEQGSSSTKASGTTGQQQSSAAPSTNDNRLPPVRLVPGSDDVINGTFDPHPEPVFAVQDGKVIRMGWQDPNNTSGGLGFRISVDEGDGYRQYGHMDPNTVTIRVGDKVTKGELIGDYANPTNGSSTGPHVHEEFRLWSDPKHPVNPGLVSPLMPNGRITTPYNQVDPSHSTPHQGVDWAYPPE